MTDARSVRALLARAYVEDPVTKWIFPDPELRLHASAAWYGLFVDQYLAGRGRWSVRVDDGAPVAVAMWRLPGDPGLVSDGLPTIAGLLGALVGARRADELGTALHGIAAITPEEPHAYLNFLAVEPTRQGRHLGRNVLDEVLAAADDAGLPTCLESANPANVSFYERAGFGVTARLQLGPDGPTLQAMRRDPAR